MPDETHVRQLVVFTLGQEQYALPIEHVHEIIRYEAPRSVAAPIPWIRGVISLRGHIVAVLDLSARLGVQSEHNENAKIVIVESGSEAVGVIVDEVEEVLSIGEGAFEDVPGADAELVDSIVKIGDRLVVLIKPEMIFGAFTSTAAQVA
ncbi:MAG: chemotaxis protein CheW [Solirubrobacteraceae bacterium]